MTKAKLEEMFVGKKVKITYVYGPKNHQTRKVNEGMCKAIHETPGEIGKFDIELKDGKRFGFSPTEWSENSCTGNSTGWAGGTRKIEVIE